MKTLQDNLYLITLIILSLVTIISVNKVINTYFYYMNFNDHIEEEFDSKLILSGMLISITIILILLCTIYTIIYARSKLNIPFEAPYFLTSVIFVAFPLFISLSLINSFGDIIIDQEDTITQKNYLILLPKSMIVLNLCYIILTLYVLEVFKKEKKYFDKEFSKQSFVLLIFFGTGFFFTNVIIGISFLLENAGKEEIPGLMNTLFYFSFASVIISMLYLFLAIALEMEVKFQGGKRKSII